MRGTTNLHVRSVDEHLWDVAGNVNIGSVDGTAVQPRTLV